MNVDGAKIWESNSVTFRGVHIDGSLKFDKHITELCKNAGRKFITWKYFSAVILEPFYPCFPQILIFFKSTTVYSR